jgi:curved DNA-binding protein
MTFVDYYKILGLVKTATPAEIKSAYRKLARKHHPDLNPTDKEAIQKFQHINEANEVLSDPVKRKKYDQYGENWEHGEEYEKQQQQQQQQSYNSNRERQSEDDYSSFFESMFGGATGGSRSRQSRFRGQDYNSELQLNLLDAYKTHTQTITVNGKNIRITIPAGIENGQTIKITGHGGVGSNGGPNGDLYIVFSIATHPVFKRLGNNLHVAVDIDVYTAVLGGVITVETLSGKVKLKVAPETQNGSKIKLTGKGFPVYKREGTFGDLYITYTVKIPTHLTDKQKALFTELSKS